MAYVLENLNAHIQDNIQERVHSSFVEFRPLFYIFGLKSPEGRSELGRPKTSAVFGNGGMTGVQIENRLGTQDFQVRFQKTEPNDGTTVEFGGTTPTAGQFAEDNLGTARTRWTHFSEPMKIRGHSLEMAKGATAVGDIADTAMAPVWEAFVKRIHTSMWTGTLTQAQQSNTLWTDLLGLQHTLTANNYYGSVDRSVETNLNPTTINAATQLPTAEVSLELPRLINNGFTDTAGTAIQGLAGRARNGIGATCVITEPDLWRELASDAEGHYQITTNGIPGHPMGGFKAPIIMMDNFYITRDPGCPTGVMACLNLDTWIIEIMRGHNFVFTGLKEKWEREEGGEYYLWGNFDAMIRMTCTEPWNNAWITNLSRT